MNRWVLLDLCCFFALNVRYTIDPIPLWQIFIAIITFHACWMWGRNERLVNLVNMRDRHLDYSSSFRR